MGRKVFVVGVGMTKFERPGSHERDYPDLVFEAVSSALDDAGVSYADVDQAIVGYVYGDSTSGQRSLYRLGLTGLPVYNVNNNCATGSSALFLGKQLIEGGICDCVLVSGFEKMLPKGTPPPSFPDRAYPMDHHLSVMEAMRGKEEGSTTAQIFGNAGREHMERYGTTAEQIAKIAVKNHAHSVNNPNAQFQTAFTLTEVLESPVIYEPLTRLACCPTSDGAAAALLCSEEFVDRHDLSGQAVAIAGMAMGTDLPGAFAEDSSIRLIGSDMARMTALRAYEQADLGPAEVDVIELHDCFATNELVTYEALGLCAEGEAGQLIDSGAVTYGGRWVVNPSGGLISKGHPLGATGLAQCAELAWQLRGCAEGRQVPGARVGLQHNLGLGGAVVVGIYVGPDGVMPQ